MPHRPSLWKLGCLLPVAAVLSGCATAPHATFEDSNQLFLEQTMANLDVAHQIRQVVPASSKLCLVSMEKEETLDHPVVSLVEDGIISDFLTGGFTVYERDSDVVKRLISESSGDRYRLMYFPEDIAIASLSGAAGVSAAGGSYNVPRAYLHGGFGTTHISGAGRDTFLTLETQLQPADFLVSYRVLECGLVYRPASENRNKLREGLVRLHLRVQDANSGEIRYAGNLSAEYSDEIDRRLVRDLADFHYSFYSRDLPLHRGSYRGRRELSGGPAAGTGQESGIDQTTAVLGITSLAVLVVFLIAGGKGI